MLHGRHQTLAIVLMNALEFRCARELLLATRARLVASALLWATGWYVASSVPA